MKTHLKHWKFCNCLCSKISLPGLGLPSDAELISLVEKQDTWTWGNTVVWLPGWICFRLSQLWFDCDYLICQNNQQIVRLRQEECHQASVSLILFQLCTSVLQSFSVLFFLSLFCLDFSECVPHTHLKVSVTIGISFRSHQTETSLFGGENSSSIKAISAATVALIGTGSQISPTEVIRQEVSRWEVDLNVTGLQTAIGLLSFLTQTGSQWSYVDSMDSPTKSLRNQRFSSVMLYVWFQQSVRKMGTCQFLLSFSQ